MKTKIINPFLWRNLMNKLLSFIILAGFAVGCTSVVTVDDTEKCKCKPSACAKKCDTACKAKCSKR